MLQLIYILRKGLLHAVSLSVFLLFGGMPMLKWALLFAVVVELLPANAWFASRTAVYTSGVTLLCLHFGLNPLQAIIIGSFLALWPLRFIGAAPGEMISPTAIFPSGFAALAYYLGMPPIAAFIFGSFVITKIYLLMLFNTKLLDRKVAKELMVNYRRER